MRFCVLCGRRRRPPRALRGSGMARDPYRYFRVEGRELLDQLGKGALELSKRDSAPELIATMLRLAHTLKGASRVVKQREIADCAHAIESALSPFRDGGQLITPDVVEATQKALDEIASRLSALGPQTQNAESPTSPGSSASPNEAHPLDPISANAEERDVVLEGLRETSVQLANLRHGIGSLQQGRRLAQLLGESATARSAGLTGGKLLSTVAQLRELIEAVHRNSSDAIEQMERELMQVREAAQRLRLLPASLMFVPLERAARDVAAGLGKRVAFMTSGGDIRLDAQVLGAVQSALVQAVRNAVAHGIETPAEREAVDKSVDGRVWVEVRRRGHQVVFHCRDDGRGIDLDAVRRAVARKELSPGEAAKLGTDELLELLLSGGISTSSAITQHAGRGIGLDVVREAVSRLRGEINIRTEKGNGTQLEIIVPVTLASLDALMVESASRMVAIPLDAVKRTLRIATEEIAESADGSSIVFDGKVVPFAPLERALSPGSAKRGGVRSWSTVIIEGANALAALGVERLRGTQNLMLRPLPELAPSDPIVAGASFDAEGHPQLVLDPEGLIEHVRRVRPAASTAQSRAPILIIDDSLTTRMLEQSILETAGYEVELATSGEEALERAGKRRYALFLVDVEMPGMDGFTFIERTRSDPALRDVPAVLVTSRASPEDRQRGVDAGARAYIVKGEFDQTELLEQIRRLVGAQ
jgi:two-component system chemotaxis sensor kinase CheA